MDKDLKIIWDCINWAIQHGYNPFNSTVKEDERRYMLLQSLDVITKEEHCVLTELLEGK